MASAYPLVTSSTARRKIGAPCPSARKSTRAGSTFASSVQELWEYPERSRISSQLPGLPVKYAARLCLGEVESEAVVELPTSAVSVMPSSSVSTRSGRALLRISCRLINPSPSKSSSPSGMPFSSVSNLRGFVRAQYSCWLFSPSLSTSPSESDSILPVVPTCETATPPLDTHHVSPSSMKPLTWPERICQFVTVFSVVVVLVPSTVVLVVVE